jgi:subfamily B ATP-binding cassette protein MsbA
MVRVEQGVMRDLRNSVYAHLQVLPFGYFHKRKTGHIISRVTSDVHLIRGAVTDGLATFVRESLLAGVYLLVAFWASWRLSLVAVAVVPASALLIASLGRRIRRRGRRIQEKMAEVTSVLQETLFGIRIIRAFGMEGRERRKFFAQTAEYMRAAVRFESLILTTGPLMEILGVVVAVAVLLYGGYEIWVAKTLDPSRFVVFLAGALSLMQPVKKISNANHSIQQGIVAAERVFGVLDSPPEPGDRPGAVPLEGIRGSIVFREISFRYDAGPAVLEDVSFRVNVGEVVALVGPSGAGKSTVVDLLPRFYEQTSGTIEIDGRDTREFRTSSLRQLIGIVTQETILFNDTVHNNIAYAKEGASRDEVCKAATTANAHDFIIKLPQGYDTVIGERGLKISGGERQRLAIARAVLRNPPILIFDEATSALDTESELFVQQAIEHLMENRTTFVIAHRLSTVKRAHRIIVLDKGRIVEMGTHAELMAQAGLYRHLYDLQFRV